MGHPLQCGKEFINIDPMAFDDPVSGKHLLYWGSGFAPIKVQELSRDRMSFAPGSVHRDLVWPAPSRNSFPALVEGAWVVHRDGRYYLFYSGDNCCGAKANYAVMVARSNSPLGPFERSRFYAVNVRKVSGRYCAELWQRKETSQKFNDDTTRLLVMTSC